MVCVITCSLAVGFVAASLLVMITKSDKHLKLRNALEEQSRGAYDKIVAERTKLFIKGSIIGLIAALLFYFWAKNKMNNVSIVCLFISIIFIVQVLFYILTPKSDYILNHIKTQEQAKLWYDVYKDMKFKYHLGFIIGIVGYGVLCYSMAKDRNITLY